MLTQFLAIAALILALLTILAGYFQPSALNLRQEQQPLYWSRHGTELSGYYRNQTWQPLPSRTAYSSFRGGGPGAGK
ncbi:hypothetical protein [Leptolyngbya sp. FACHB-261]|uniref:hypothetical protein n=1 Tax=Leptolyngbya sp. FACHB-261 TaxID=2692806 RepID=UPI0016843852|nr:hypothetical protein [Leptolyngbya sp. FACHB-261]MBD2103632.1 hypothetical protein [Leptolyngbya sp. FACHB-261]